MDPHPFQSLEVPEGEPLPRAMVDRWVTPFYMRLHQLDTIATRNEVFDLLAGPCTDMTVEVVQALLRNRNWRSRIVGAHLAACKDLRELTEWIGRLLLRSDLCYAARGYCVALAHFNTRESTSFLLEYLHYYLGQLDLDYDQSDAMAAIAYLDSRNGTSNRISLMASWTRFAAGHPSCDLDAAIAGFALRMAQISALSARCSDTPS